MKTKNNFDVIIVGGSYAGLAAGLTLGRALRHVLIIDSGDPCNKQTPYSHNLLTHDGDTPAAIAALAREQVKQYPTVQFCTDMVTDASRFDNGFKVTTWSGAELTADKLLFATGIKDKLPAIEGLKDCWGISVLHCPYCHGYEVRNKPTAILSKGEHALELVKLLSNWTNELIVLTNEQEALPEEHEALLRQRGVKAINTAISGLQHKQGQLEKIVFADNSELAVEVLYAPSPFEQATRLPEKLGCHLTEEGYLQVDAGQQTTVAGVYASGDNTTRTRTLANAISQGTTAAIAINKQLIEERFV